VFTKTTEELKESIGIKELGEIRSNLAGTDLFPIFLKCCNKALLPRFHAGNRGSITDALPDRLRGDLIEVLVRKVIVR
jgi:hypothetical protein